MKAFVTGLSGWVASALVSHLLTGGHAVSGSTRHGMQSHSRFIKSIDHRTDWTDALEGIDVVFHLASRIAANDLRTQGPGTMDLFREVNVHGSINLLQQSARAGVRRFVYVSSVKALGDMSVPGRPMRWDDAPDPQDAYGRSKHEAELALKSLAPSLGVDLVVVRPPVVYGPGVKANIAALVNAVRKGIPLPLGAVVSNRRSYLALDNLVDFLMLCAVAPDAAHRTFMVSDGEDVSTANFVTRLGNAIGAPARLFQVPPPVLHWGSRLLGQRHALARLVGNLQVDVSATQQILNWRPPLSLDAGLARLRTW